LQLDLFCRVVDNFGDIGVCWRLGRRFMQKYGCAVMLWMDDPASIRTAGIRRPVPPSKLTSRCSRYGASRSLSN
jgi:hypothetical protein